VFVTHVRAALIASGSYLHEAVNSDVHGTSAIDCCVRGEVMAPIVDDVFSDARVQSGSKNWNVDVEYLFCPRLNRDDHHGCERQRILPTAFALGSSWIRLLGFSERKGEY